MNSLCRRRFLSRCGLAAIGGLLLPPLVAPSRLEAAVSSGRYLSAHDRTVLQMLSAYSGDAYLWGGTVYSRVTGAVKTSGPTQMLILVRDYAKLFAFLNSATMKSLGVVRADGNTLAFTSGGSNYVVTNSSADDFHRIVSTMSNPPSKDLANAAALLSAFTFDNVLYHPATDTILDPYLGLKTHGIELAGKPAGSLKVQFQTLVDGWLAAKQYDLALGKSFAQFQSALLASETTAKAAEQIAQAWVQNITALSAAYDVAGLRPLLLSPLVASSLEEVFHLDVDAAVNEVEKLRGQADMASYTDASIWLAVLLSAEIKNGTVSEWITIGKTPSDAAARAALNAAKKLVAAGVGSI